MEADHTPTAAELWIVLCTCPDERVAAEIATALVAAGVAACVNRLPGVRSLYRWEGRIQEDSEVLLIIKTPPAHFAALESMVRERHPYDVPEIIALPVAAGNPAYLEWARRATEQ